MPKYQGNIWRRVHCKKLKVTMPTNLVYPCASGRETQWTSPLTCDLDLLTSGWHGFSKKPFYQASHCQTQVFPESASLFSGFFHLSWASLHPGGGTVLRYAQHYCSLALGFTSIWEVGWVQEMFRRWAPCHSHGTETYFSFNLSFLFILLPVQPLLSHHKYWPIQKVPLFQGQTFVF